MTRYLISFAENAMDHIPEEEMLAVGKAAHDVTQEAIDADVWIFGGGMESRKASIVATDGTVTDGTHLVGGISIIDASSPKEALGWAAKVAAACRCAIVVSEFGPDPEQDEMLRQANSRP